MTRETFEDRLLTELKREIAAREADAPAPAPARRPVVTRLRVAVVATATAAVAGGLLIGLPGGAGTSPAYAVEHNPDGSVTITWDEYLAADSRAALWEELSPALNDAGVHTVHEPAGPLSCGERETYVPLDQPGGERVRSVLTQPDGTVDYTSLVTVVPEESEGTGGRPAPGEAGVVTVRAGDTVIFDTGAEGMSVTAIYEGVICEPAA
ncbi:hypothetical protein [Streptomyces marincola]|uniref:hypothetical protein n=1 Tax=Streptomyces marincola TaxID=2878388 RepID=UPI001CF4F6DA|nr:hypothetical protein [Streptomyces marincola]UCM90491.1 hypothetical protein LC193_22555 [Streptomyces marincola]